MKTQRITRLGLLAAWAVSAAASAQPTGGFFVHLNQQQNNSDSRRSVTFYSADDLNSGAASPLFSVHVPGEIIGPGSYNFEEVSAIAADPFTGDVYVAAFDSGDVGSVETGGEFSPADSDGDLDIYRIDFATVYDHWASNFQGTTVTAGSTPGVGGAAPFIPAGAPAGGFDDYITYSSLPQVGAGLNFDDLNRAHSNTFSLPGSIEKIAEVKRNNGAGFFPFALEFINDSTLLLLDNDSAAGAEEMASNDHAFRLIERVATTPGLANDSSADYLDGGFNNGTTESWNSRVIGLVNQDFAGGVPTGHSEPESIAYYSDPVTGTSGFWVTESDGGGDDVAFYDILAGAYRQQQVGGGPDYPTSFALDNDPLSDPTSNDGKAEHIFVDADTGDLIIVESGFGDAADGISDADHEPAVIRREVLTYDNGEGRIQFGAWSEKKITTPVKEPSDNMSGGGQFLERGHWAAYNSEEDKVYFLNPSGGSGTAPFQADIMVLDVATGLTTNLLNVDESISLFFGDSFGDVADYFFLGDDTPLAGDYNSDGVVDAADYTVWRDGDSPDSSQAGYDLWAENYGATAATAAGVPEPATAGLALLGAAALLRRRSQRVRG
ncbi:PEP-CTERM sorting domain-containing protein [Botrimarina sp.]|uniref:PEP-CTERM sorting domain-containing protein n=1 Tax=Botrimarina sp. TaxID=2795802 RepID=UPI0032EF3392